MINIDPPSSPLADLTALSKAALTRFLNRARTAVGLTGEVEVLLTSDAELKRLNKAFRGKNKATDVLSFPTPPAFGNQHTDEHAGDLAISLETAARQAAAFGHSLEDEVRILLLHGLLHLSGLDHETDNGEMAAREAQLRDQLRLPNGLIARTVGTEIQPTKVTKQKLPASKSAAKKILAKKTVPTKAATKVAKKAARKATTKAPARKLSAKRVRS